MPAETQKSIKKQILYGVIFYAAVFLLLALISYSKELSSFLSAVLALFRPILIGFGLAYLCNPIFRFFERKLFYRLRPSALRRGISLFFTYAVVFGAVACLLLLILPKIGESIFNFAGNYSSYVDGAILNINNVFAFLNSTIEQLIGKDDFFQPITDSQFLESIGRILFDEKNGILSKIDLSTITGVASSVVGAVTDFIFAFFISLYFLSSKEKRYAQVMKFRNAIFNDQINQRITKICTTADNLFGKFLEGKLIDSVIVGVLLYICLSIFGVPYVLLISTMTAVLNIIPVVGYLVSILPGSLLIFLTDVDRLLPYLIIVLIIYQIDVNILSPKLLGNNTGVSSLCVIVSICIMGGIWGYIGMILAVPLAATFLDLVDSIIHRRLQKKRMPDDVENYYAPDSIINPIRRTSTGKGRLVKRLEKKVLHARALVRSGNEDKLTATDRTALKFYAWARKVNLLKDTPHDILTQFAAEEAERNMYRAAPLMREKYLQKATQAASRDEYSESNEGGNAE